MTKSKCSGRVCDAPVVVADVCHWHAEHEIISLVERANRLHVEHGKLVARLGELQARWHWVGHIGGEIAIDSDVVFTTLDSTQSNEERDKEAFRNRVEQLAAEGWPKDEPTD